MRRLRSMSPGPMSLHLKQMASRTKRTTCSATCFCSSPRRSDDGDDGDGDDDDDDPAEPGAPSWVPPRP